MSLTFTGVLELSEVINWVPMEKVLVKEINDGTMGFPIDRLSRMTFGFEVDGQRVLFTGSNNDFATRPRFTQNLAWLVGNPAPEANLES